MNTFLRYFRHHFVTTLARLLTVTVFVTGSYLVCALPIVYGAYNPIQMDNLAMMSELAIIMPLLTLLMPVLEFSPILSKRNSDVILSLPISKVTYLLVNYLNGLIQLIIIYTSLYFAWFFCVVCHAEAQVRFAYLPGQYFSLLAAIITIYTFFSCIFLQARAPADGIILEVLWILFPFFIITLIGNYSDNNIFQSLDPLCSILPMWPLVLVSAYTGIVRFPPGPFSSSIIMPDLFTVDRIAKYIWPGIIISIVLMVISLVIMYFTAKKLKSNELGDTTDSWLGYKLLGSVYSIGGMLLFSDIDPFINIIVFCIMFAGYCIYRRGIHFKKSDLAVMGISTLLMIISFIK